MPSIDSTSISRILDYHFTVTIGNSGNRLHKSKVLDIFRLYSPNMSMRSLVSLLRPLGIQYNDSLREFGDSRNKGIFIGLDVKTTVKNQELKTPVTVPQGYHGKPLAATWQSRIKKLNSLGLQIELTNGNYDNIINILTRESESLDSICTSITAVLNLLNTAGADKTNNHFELVEKLVALRQHFKDETYNSCNGKDCSVSSDCNVLGG